MVSLNFALDCSIFLSRRPSVAAMDCNSQSNQVRKKPPHGSKNNVRLMSEKYFTENKKKTSVIRQLTCGVFSEI